MPSAKDTREKIIKDVESMRGTTNTPGLGNVVSVPGTEKILFDATTFQLMECDARVKGNDKKRYCLVEKGVKASSGNQFVNSMGERAYVIPHDLCVFLIGILNNISKQLRDLDSLARMNAEKAELYKLTVDALRKNGIID